MPTSPVRRPGFARRTAGGSRSGSIKGLEPMRKSLIFLVTIAPLLSSGAVSASPLLLQESSMHTLASADAADAARCSLDRQFVLSGDRATAKLDRKGFDTVDAGYLADNRWTPRGGT